MKNTRLFIAIVPDSMVLSLEEIKMGTGDVLIKYPNWAVVYILILNVEINSSILRSIECIM